MEVVGRSALVTGAAGGIGLAQWAAARDRLGIVDILVNNAGIGPDGVALADMDPAAFDRMIRLNLTSVFNGVSAFAGEMRRRGSGHIVNTASMAGLRTSATIGAYTAAKFAVVGMSEVLRAELAPHGVGVSVLCPGLVATRLRETTRRAGSDTPVASSVALAQEPMDADIVGQMVVRAIRADRPLIVTHPEYRDAVAARGQAVLAAFDALS